MSPFEYVYLPLPYLNYDYDIWYAVWVVAVVDLAIGVSCYGFAGEIFGGVSGFAALGDELER